MNAAEMMIWRMQDGCSWAGDGWQELQPLSEPELIIIIIVITGFWHALQSGLFPLQWQTPTLPLSWIVGFFYGALTGA